MSNLTSKPFLSIGRATCGGKGTVVVAALAAFGTAGCKSEAVQRPPTAGAAQPVQAIAVVPQKTERTWTYAGTVEPRYEAGLGFRVGGKVLERLVDEGQAVTAGQAIARIDPVDFELSAAAQEAELTAAKMSLNEAEASLARYRTLFGQGHVSKAALDQRTSGEAEARARVDRAGKALELARNQLSYAVLRSEQAGVVTAVNFERGQVVSAGQIVAKVAQLDAIEVEVGIPENQLADVRQAHAEAELWQSGKRIAAELREVSPQADSATRTYRARFALPAFGEPAFGRTATLHLKSGYESSAVALPLSAVMNDGGGAKVWVLSGDKTKAAPLPVEVKAVERDRVLVTAPFKAGDLVVSMGVHMLDPGKPVRLVEQRQALSASTGVSSHEQ